MRNGKDLLTVEMPLTWAGEAIPASPSAFSSFPMQKKKKTCLEIAKVRGVWALSCSDPDTGLCPDTSPEMAGTDGSRQISNEVFVCLTQLEGHVEGCNFSMPCSVFCWIRSS